MDKYIKHFENIKFLYGNDSYVQVPNSIFKSISQISKNIKQVSFAYSFMIVCAFMYKYAHFVDVNNNSYIQSKDIKEILGYSKATKSIDKIIKKDGVLEQLNLIKTTKDYPVLFDYIDDELNGVRMREFTTINSANKDSDFYKAISSTVKNKNYEIKYPSFIFDNDGNNGTLYQYDDTFRINIDELLFFIFNKNIDNIDFLLYSFFKSKCYGLKNNKWSSSLDDIINETGISKATFYEHLKKIKSLNLINVNHKQWVNKNVMVQDSEPNDYFFISNF